MNIRVYRRVDAHMFELWVNGRLKSSHGITTIWDAVGALIRKKPFFTTITVEYCDMNTPTGRAKAEKTAETEREADIIKLFEE